MVLNNIKLKEGGHTSSDSDDELDELDIILPHY
jgi:hypothetical protein